MTSSASGVGYSSLAFEGVEGAASRSGSRDTPQDGGFSTLIETALAESGGDRPSSSNSASGSGGFDKPAHNQAARSPGRITVRQVLGTSQDGEAIEPAVDKGSTEFRNRAEMRRDDRWNDSLASSQILATDGGGLERIEPETLAELEGEPSEGSASAIGEWPAELPPQDALAKGESSGQELPILRETPKVEASAHTESSRQQNEGTVNQPAAEGSGKSLSWLAGAASVGVERASLETDLSPDPKPSTTALQIRESADGMAGATTLRAMNASAKNNDSGAGGGPKNLSQQAWAAVTTALATATEQSPRIEPVRRSGDGVPWTAPVPGSETMAFASALISSPQETVPELNAVAAAAVTPPVPVPDLEGLLLNQIVQLRELKAQSMAVTLHPDEATELFVRVNRESDRLLVHVQCDRGDANRLAGQWSALEAALAQQGARLAPLNEPLPAQLGTHRSPETPPQPDAHDTGGRRHPQRPASSVLDELPMVGSLTEPLRRRGVRSAVTPRRAWESWA